MSLKMISYCINLILNCNVRHTFKTDDNTVEIGRILYLNNNLTLNSVKGGIRGDKALGLGLQINKDLHMRDFANGRPDGVVHVDV
jgi:hypothetical protein